MDGKQSRPPIELLAPAGSFESMEAAIRAGADAVYMGGSRFGARAYAENPDDERLLAAIDFVHLHGRKLYLTVNTLFKERELEEDLAPFLAPLYRRGLDAVIVQDLGVLSFIRSHFPELPIHVSTQTTVSSVWGARQMRKLGADRLVLPRELSLSEIAAICRENILEIETFVHGALCYCYSGQCLMSSLIGGRSGNRGRCAQPCRLPYNGLRLMNLKDLCTLDILPDILEAGVISLKIEGRMKSPRYSAGVTALYRRYLDQYLEKGRKNYRVREEDRKLLAMLSSRGHFTDGYYLRHNGGEMLDVKEKPKGRTVDERRIQAFTDPYFTGNFQEKIKGKVIFYPEKPATIELNCKNVSVTYCGDVVQKAQKQPINQETVGRCLQKTGDAPFQWEELDILVSRDAFLPVSAVNRLRREAFALLSEEICRVYQRVDRKSPVS